MVNSTQTAATVTAEPVFCPNCKEISRLEQVGSASGRPHYHCAKCGPWVGKHPAAVALGSLGGRASSANLSKEARIQRAEDAANARWRAQRLRQNWRPPR